MSLHKKTHRMLLVVGFIYLTMCPHSYEVTFGLFDYSAIGSRIESVEQRAHRWSGHSMPPAAAPVFCGELYAAVDSVRMLRLTSTAPHDLKPPPFTSSILLL